MIKLKLFLVTLLPHHLLSRIMFLLTRSSRFPFLKRIMRHYIKKYDIDMNEAQYSDLDAYPTMNALFTRALKPEARPVDKHPESVCSPVDGTVSEIGKIDQNRLFQAKNHSFVLQALMGGLENRARPFYNGSFATVYLSPKDYHRVHMPYEGKLREMIHVPGRLFSVAPDYVDNIPRLFARNERVISIFDTDHGPMAVILVGAIFVSSIETVWAGTIVPPHARRVTVVDYTHGPHHITLAKGEEMGRFNMGSTVIVLFADRVQWEAPLTRETRVVLGRKMGRFGAQDTPTN